MRGGIGRGYVQSSPTLTCKVGPCNSRSADPETSGVSENPQLATGIIRSVEDGNRQWLHRCANLTDQIWAAPKSIDCRLGCDLKIIVEIDFVLMNYNPLTTMLFFEFSPASFVQRRFMRQNFRIHA